MKTHRLDEDEGGGIVNNATASNLTSGVKNTVLPMGKVARRKKKSDDIYTEIDDVLEEAWNNAWSSAFSMWLDDARTAKSQGQMGRYHRSMASFHHEQYAKLKSSGDSQKAEQHLKQKKDHEAKAKQHESLVARSPGTNIPRVAPTTKYIPSRRDRIKAVKASEMRQYYDVPFSKKDEAKKLGMKWDPDKKSWYYPYVWGEHLPDKFKKKDV